jgi:hypothetical protein
MQEQMITAVSAPTVEGMLPGDPGVEAETVIRYAASVE